MMKKPYSIIIVDDESGIRMLLGEFLTMHGYNVSKAHDGPAALTCMESQRFDLIISDIRMPGMNGFELLKTVEERFPYVKRMLMTGYDIDGYIDMIRHHNIGNILAKATDLTVEAIGIYVGAILTGEIFGLDRYIPVESIKCGLICTHAQAQAICAQISSEYPAEDRFSFSVSVNELISNAIFHGALNLTNVSRELWSDDFAIAPEKAVRVCWGITADKIGVSVEDRSGNLRKVDVLRWLDHPIDESVNVNEHGRGFLLVRKFIDRFIVNISPGKRTECIMLQNLDRSRREKKKPLLIHEL